MTPPQATIRLQALTQAPLTQAVEATPEEEAQARTGSDLPVKICFLLATSVNGWYTFTLSKMPFRSDSHDDDETTGALR